MSQETASGSKRGSGSGKKAASRSGSHKRRRGPAWQSMLLLVDKREDRSGDTTLADTLDAAGLRWERRTLIVADFALVLCDRATPEDPTLWRYVALVERKTTADMHASILDGRYRAQMARMLRTRVPVLYYFMMGGEGGDDDGIYSGVGSAEERTKRVLSATIHIPLMTLGMVNTVHVPCEQLLGHALVKLTEYVLQHQYTESPQELPAATTVAQAYREGSDGDEDDDEGTEEGKEGTHASDADLEPCPDVVMDEVPEWLSQRRAGVPTTTYEEGGRIRKATDQADVFRLQLSVINGVSPVVARRIADRFGCMAGLLAALINEGTHALNGIPGVGKKRADSILMALHPPGIVVPLSGSRRS